jgi:beta-galactosidase
MDRKRGVGLAWWGAIEYWGESDGWPKKGWNYSFFNHTLEPYPQAYLIKSCLNPAEPLVKIGIVDGKGESKMWNDIKVGSERINQNWNQKEGSRMSLMTYTNAEEVELIYNGKSLGTQKNDTTKIENRNIIKWNNIDYGKGGKLVAIARTGGKEVARDMVETTGKAVALKVVIEGNSPVTTFNTKTDTWKADGMSLQYLKVYAVDSKGRIVRNATNEVSIKVSGEASLVAMDNGDHYTSDLFSGVSTKTMQTGFMQVILRSTQRAGKVTVEVTSPTLKGAKATMTSSRH